MHACGSHMYKCYRYKTVHHISLTKDTRQLLVTPTGMGVCLCKCNRVFPGFLFGRCLPWIYPWMAIAIVHIDAVVHIDDHVPALNFAPSLVTSTTDPWAGPLSPDKCLVTIIAAVHIHPVYMLLVLLVSIRLLRWHIDLVPGSQLQLQLQLQAMESCYIPASGLVLT